MSANRISGLKQSRLIENADEVIDMNKNKKIDDDQLEKTTGGEDISDYWTNKNCPHEFLSVYDEYREKSYFIFWSIKQRRCRCERCFEEIWIDVE